MSFFMMDSALFESGLKHSESGMLNIVSGLISIKELDKKVLITSYD